MKLLCTYILTFFSAVYFSPKTNKPLDDFLTNPFDLQKFKKAKQESNSGGATKKSYYYKPNEKGFLMSFSLFPPLSGYIGETPGNDIYMEDGITIVTYKPDGKNQKNYLDPTEILIEVIAKFNDNDLPELAFIGLDTAKVKKKLGDNFLRKDSCFIYAKDKTALTLKISGKRVEWLKYTRLNFALTKDNIPSGLLTMNN
jgi:hypothetical protein